MSMPRPRARGPTSLCLDRTTSLQREAADVRAYVVHAREDIEIARQTRAVIAAGAGTRPRPRGLAGLPQTRGTRIARNRP